MKCASARSTGVVLHALQVCQTCKCVTLLHSRAQRGAQEAADGSTGRPTARSRVITAPRRSWTLTHRTSSTHKQIQAGTLLTACWGAPDAAAASHCYPSKPVLLSSAWTSCCLWCLSLAFWIAARSLSAATAEDVEPPPCMRCPPAPC